MWKELFVFNSSERRGIIVLIFLIFVVLLVTIFYDSFADKKTYDFSGFINEIQAFQKQLVPKDEAYYEQKRKELLKAKYDTIKLFDFNPNTTSFDDWKKLGFSDKQAKIIGNFVEKGGNFKTKADLAKIYGISPEQFAIIEPYIKLPDFKAEDKKFKHFDKKTVKPEYFEFNPNNTSLEEWKKLGLSEKQANTVLNYLAKGGKFKTKDDLANIYGISPEQFTALEPYISLPVPIQKEPELITLNIENAQAEQFTQIKGIGEKIAANILKYRSSLGGFYSKEQLKEVYGISAELYEKIENQIIIGQNPKLTQININFADEKELDKHPYIDFQQAKAIVAFRTKNGSYKKVEQLIDNKILTKTTFEKIKHYLKTEN